MLDRLKQPVHRGDRLLDAWGEMWVVSAPAVDHDKAHMQSLKTGARVQTTTSIFLLPPKGWRDKEKYPDLKKWYRHKVGIA